MADSVSLGMVTRQRLTVGPRVGKNDFQTSYKLGATIRYNVVGILCTQKTCFTKRLAVSRAVGSFGRFTKLMDF